MSVVDINSNNAFTPAIYVMEGVRLTKEQAPGLFVLLRQYCALHPELAATAPQSRTQKAAACVHISEDLYQHFAIMRLYPRPLFWVPEDISDKMYCAAAIMSLNQELLAKAKHNIAPREMFQTPLGDGLNIAAEAGALIEDTDNAKLLERRFKKTSPEGRFVFLSAASQLARHYIDTDIQVTERRVTATFSSFQLRKRRAETYKIMSNIIKATSQLDDKNQSGMLDNFRAMMHTIERLEGAKAAEPSAQSPTLKKVVIPSSKVVPFKLHT